MSLMFDDEYEPASSYEATDLLADIPFDLIMANIMEQIDDPLANKINYVDIIVDKCEICKEVLSHDEDAIRQINEELRDFFTKIIQAMDDKFNLVIDLEGLATYNDIIEIGKVLYEYFIIRYTKNISKYIVNYINEHKKEFVDYYSGRGQKDVTSIAHKKSVDNPDDLIILSNLASIVNYIVGLDVTPYEFVSLTGGKNNFNCATIKSLIINNQLVGDFVSQYIDVSVTGHDYLVDEILTDIKTKLAKKL